MPQAEPISALGAAEPTFRRATLADVPAIRELTRAAYVRAQVATIGAQTHLYRLACPDEVAWMRIGKRNASVFIARSTFEALKSRFQALQGDEERVEVVP